ncbi:plasmid maintenance system antidote protein [Pedobacter sp. L105]|uniref:helix-turn-helix transcriptional regulator n=1 Tax=Pedobacter sp. L105 TaxID=1641871 RepID=UPI00131DA299|nr:plasmid maintenance system antidote protein [Pedobacter sp. L105]
MINPLSVLKGIHPGVFLERELKKRNLSKGRFALSVNEYPQTIGAITNEKRAMNTALSLKIEEALGLEEGTLMTLQVFYDIKKEKQKNKICNGPDISLIRPSLFWDTPIAKIDWDNQKKSVIRRIFERGNEQEKQEIVRFYGNDIVSDIIGQLSPDQQLPLSGRTN